MAPSLYPAAPTVDGAAAPSSDFSITPALLIRAFRKHWLILVLSVAVCLAGAAAYTARQVKIYEASATVQLDPQPLRPLGGAFPSSMEQGPESYWSNQEYFATQHQVITSRKVASMVVRKLGLTQDASFIDNDPPGPARKLDAKVAVEVAAEVLRSRLKVSAVQDSRLASVKYVDANPERAQRVLATLLDVYVDQNLDATLTSAGKTAEWLDAQRAKLKEDLEKQEMDLHDFKKSNNLLSVSFDDQSNMLREEIVQLNTAITSLKAKHEKIAARLEVLKSINPDEPVDFPAVSDVTGHSEGFHLLRARYLATKTKLQEYKVRGKGENHPDVAAEKAEHEAARAHLLGELANLRKSVEADLAAITRELQGVSGLYESAKKQAMDLNINELRYSRLQRAKNNTQKVYSLVVERSAESDLSKVMPFNNVRVLDAPLRPTFPVLPSRSKNLALGGALGLLLGLFGAVGRELLDRTVRSTEDAERDLGLPALGALPDVESGQHGVYSSHYGKRRRKKHTSVAPAEPVPTGPLELLVHTHSKSVVAEAARAIRTNLLFTSPDRPYQTIVVTSAGPAEGKTTVASSIAIAMAQTGQSVCLVDCDLRRPRLHKLFRRDLQHGVTTALLDPAALDEAITPTDVPNLSVLPSGPLPPNPADLMHSESFSRLLAQLRERFDRVVIDSPPVNLVTDPVILSTRVDATLLVLRVKHTKRDAARRALRALRDVAANCPGFVLNAAVAGEQYDYRVYYATYGAETPDPKAEAVAS
jgi:succinoglycan biosynthesis transport protein ExoP